MVNGSCSQNRSEVMSRFAVKTIRLIGLLLAAILLNATAWSKAPKDLVKPSPLFMDPAFSFSQVDPICLSPILDLRLDKSAPIFLTGVTPELNSKHLPNASGILSGNLGWLGYATTWCQPVSTMPIDLANPSDTWLRSLNFGQSK